MPDNNQSKDYQNGLDLAEQGKHAEALECIQKYLISSPNDVEALNDTGTILHCLGRSEEAVNHLLKAKSLQQDSIEITWNLLEAYLASGNTEQVLDLLPDMESSGILNADVLNRTADALINQENLTQALRMLNWSLDIMPDQEILKPMIEVIQSKVNEKSPQLDAVIK